jgi:hypothetical protein
MPITATSVLVVAAGGWLGASVMDMATDPISGAWFDAAKDSLLVLIIVTLVVGSVSGVITWPPHKRLLQKIIDDQALALKTFTDNANRAIPTTQRVVELVEQRVIPQPEEERHPQDEDLLEAVRELTGVVSDLAGKKPPGRGRGGAA